jgi:hypothetical protein
MIPLVPLLSFWGQRAPFRTLRRCSRLLDHYFFIVARATRIVKQARRGAFSPLCFGAYSKISQNIGAFAQKRCFYFVQYDEVGLFCHFFVKNAFFFLSNVL